MDEKKNCPCEAVRQLADLVAKHEDRLEKTDERLEKQDERLERGNVNFAVICTKLNIIMAVLSVVGVAVCGAVIRIIM